MLKNYKNDKKSHLTKIIKTLVFLNRSQYSDLKNSKKCLYIIHPTSGYITFLILFKKKYKTSKTYN